DRMWHVGRAQSLNWRPGRVRTSTGVDLAPTLIETARQQALEIDYRVGDCERLDLDDAAYNRLSGPSGSCSPRTTRQQRVNWRTSLQPPAGSPWRTGLRKTAWVGYSR